ncbi:NADH-quinone oxidoreductase subunit A [Nocardioides donggukensis]|uniref:NADH-quinone oxidoreductase subunit n=1 Tax=Nocardioides donggukensis TaxID=2774019 RepID=A0A927K5X0_9ACTN|nr:NADH-quinone oxidoreductase subunit A [Nocardioides donggukensis]MBD8870408.1 NADH-quinone oxidoreductase subunit A [Nocardioides donggukensis]
MGPLFVAVLLLSVLGVLAIRALARALAVAPDPVTVLPWQSGHLPREHALSRYHPRWYVASVVFLAFDVEMLFMYPWALVVADLGAGAVIEMFAFLGVLLLAVLWAHREGAFRWA